MNKQIEQGRADGIVESTVPAKPRIDMVAIPLLSGEELLARTQPLPKWIDDMKGSGPATDSLIEYIEQMRGAQLVQQPAPVTADERAAFESLCRNNAGAAAPLQRSESGAYCNYGIQAQWVGWKARSAIAQRAAPVAAPVVGQDRAGFEAWCDIHGFDTQKFTDSNGGHYEMVGTRAYWIGWDARSQGAPVPAASVHPFQQRVQPWMMACFGAEISADTKERNHRFFEESTELVQACGMTASEAHQLVDYVYGRPVGEPMQEAGGVMVTLAALCLANGLDMHQAAEVELARIWTKVEAIRAKQAAKPKHSPLPALPNAEASIEAALTAFCDQEGYPSDGPMDGVLRKAFAAGASFAFDWKGGA